MDEKIALNNTHKQIKANFGGKKISDLLLRLQH